MAEEIDYAAVVPISAAEGGAEVGCRHIWSRDARVRDSASPQGGKCFRVFAVPHGMRVCTLQGEQMTGSVLKFHSAVASAALAFAGAANASPLPADEFRLPSNGLYRHEFSPDPQGRKMIAFESSVPCGTGCPSMPVSLLPGNRYSFSALVNADISGGVVQLMLEWRDAKGRRLGSSYGNPLNDNEVLPPGWLRYGGMTPSIPDGAKSAALFFYVSNG